MAVELREITDENRETVLAIRLPPHQERFVGSVANAMAEAAAFPHANPWYRAVYADGVAVGFVMVSWNVATQPPDIFGPYFLWKIMIDARHQGRGFGEQALRAVAGLVYADGATELLTSYLPEDGGPAGFYARLGFVPTGQHDSNGEPVVSVALPMPGRT